MNHVILECQDERTKAAPLLLGRLDIGDDRDRAFDDDSRRVGPSVGREAPPLGAGVSRVDLAGQQTKHVRQHRRRRPIGVDHGLAEAGCRRNLPRVAVDDAVDPLHPRAGRLPARTDPLPACRPGSSHADADDLPAFRPEQVDPLARASVRAQLAGPAAVRLPEAKIHDEQALAAADEVGVSLGHRCASGPPDLTHPPAVVKMRPKARFAGGRAGRRWETLDKSRLPRTRRPAGRLALAAPSRFPAGACSPSCPRLQDPKRIDALPSRVHRADRQRGVPLPCFGAASSA